MISLVGAGSTSCSKALALNSIGDVSETRTCGCRPWRSLGIRGGHREWLAGSTDWDPIGSDLVVEAYLKNMVNWDDEIPKIWTNKKWIKMVQTTNQLLNGCSYRTIAHSHVFHTGWILLANSGCHLLNHAIGAMN